MLGFSSVTCDQLVAAVPAEKDLKASSWLSGRETL